MGTSAQQHRITTGLYNTKFLCFNRVKSNKLDVDDVPISFNQLFMYTASAAGLILYMYVLCLIMVFMVNVARSDAYPFHPNTSYPLIVINYITDIDLNILIDYLLFLIAEILTCSLMPNLPKIPIFPKFLFQNYYSKILKIKYTFKKLISIREKL